MVYWIFGTLLLAIMTTGVIAVVSRPAKVRSAEHRKRFALDASGQTRIALAPEREAAPPSEPTDGALYPNIPLSTNRLIDLVRDADAPTSAIADAGVVSGPIGGKIVDTPDGEMVITTPPFVLRPQIFSKRVGRYFNRLTGRLPIWVVACPRVRLESLVTPTAPDGRDPDDWTQWRKRVRLRAIDIVICDRRSWKPLVAIMLEPAPGRRFQQRGASIGTSTALLLGGGQDRMIDEVLAHVGLPLVRGSGDLAQDWALIEPYVNEAILPTLSDEQFFDATDAANAKLDPEAAVNLLRMDADKGWMLE